MLFVIVVSASSCRQDGQSHVRPHSKTDTLEYLVSHAELVAVVEVADESHLDTDSTEGFQPTVEAKLVEIIKGEPLPGDDIKIYRMASVVVPEDHLASFGFQRGSYLVFLIARTESKNQYQPLTDRSVLMVTEGSVAPIWRRLNDTDEESVWQVTLEKAIADVMDALDQKKVTEQSAQDDGK